MFRKAAFFVLVWLYALLPFLMFGSAWLVGPNHDDARVTMLVGSAIIFTIQIRDSINGEMKRLELESDKRVASRGR